MCVCMSDLHHHINAAIQGPYIYLTHLGSLNLKAAFTHLIPAGSCVEEIKVEVASPRYGERHTYAQHASRLGSE